jgi:uncharacterized membrane protein YbhN (UPF0104 family)
MSTDQEETPETILARISLADILLLSPFFFATGVSGIYIFQSELSLIHYVGLSVLGLLFIVLYRKRSYIHRQGNHLLPSSVMFKRLNQIPFVTLPEIRLSRIRTYLRYVVENAGKVIQNHPSRLVITFVLGLLTAVCYSLVFWASAEALGASLPITTALLIGWGSQIGRGVPLPGGIGGVEVVGVTIILSLTSLSAGLAISTIVLYRILTFWSIVSIGWLIVTSKELLAEKSKVDVEP